jgi:DNA-binding MarR family transcriptional regulator
MTDDERVIIQNDMMISLLSRIAFPNDTLKKIIQKGSKKPDEILVAYNLCDGKATITEIAKRANIAQQSLSAAIDKWEQEGIIIKRVAGAEVLPKKLYSVQ